MSDAIQIGIGTLQGMGSSAGFVLVLFIGFCVVVGFTKTKKTAGGAAADRLFAAGRDGLERLLAGWSPQQHADLAKMLDQLSRALLGETADERLIAR